MPFNNYDINAVLISEDIEGLIRLGAPKTEYEAEAEAIEKAVTKIPAEEINIKTIMAIIALVWGKKFSLTEEELEKRMSRFESVAARISNILESH